MKKQFLNILTIAFAIATVGVLLDSDRVELNVTMRFVEYFAMVAILFTIISSLYFGIKFMVNKLKFIR